MDEGEKVRFLLLLILLPMAFGFSLEDIYLSPLTLETESSIATSTRFLDDSGAIANITVRWYEDSTLVRTAIQFGATNNTAIVDIIDAEEFDHTKTIIVNISAQGISFTSKTAQVAECYDGIDNDGDSLTDYPDDAECASEYDDAESPSQSCTVSGSGSYTPPQSSPIIDETEYTTYENTVEAFKDIFSTEICSNNRDDNGNGLIDESCQGKNLTITTDTGAKRFVLYVPPGSIKEDRAVKVLNLGRDAVPVTMGCEGQGCSYISYKKPTFNALPSPDLPEDIPFAIKIPLKEQEGATYVLSLTATDQLSGQKDNVLLELHLSDRPSILEALDSYFGVPYCTNISKGRAKPLCVNLYDLLIKPLAVLIGILLLLRLRQRING